MYHLSILFLLGGLIFSPVSAQAQPGATITSISPATFSTSEPVPVTITGEGFTPSSQVLLLVNYATWAMALTEFSPTSATFIPPTYLGAGVYPVIVRTEFGDSNPVQLTVAQTSHAALPTPPSGETVPPISGSPTITSVSPATTPAATLTVQGSHFTNGAQVHLIVNNAWWSMATIANAPDSLSFTLPTYLRPGTYAVVVRTPFGESNRLAFTVAEPTPALARPVHPIASHLPQSTPAPRPRYTALGDSLGLGLFSTKGYVAHFREYVSTLFQQPVELTNLSQSDWNSTQLKTALQTNAVYREAVAQADVITWNIGGNDLRYAREQYQRGLCGGADNQDCLRQAAAQLQANWSAIVAAVLELSHGEQKIIRTMDIYNPFVAEDTARDSWPADNGQSDFAVFKKYVDDTNAYIARVTVGNGLAYAPVYQTFNGTAGNEDPEDKGYISFVDGYHPDTDGHRVIGRLLSAITP